MSLKKLTLFLAASIALASCQTSSAPLEFGGNTVVYYGGGHGIQVEYYSRNGRSQLWYPGNSKTLPGWWKQQSDGQEVCYRHPSYARNPVSGKNEGDWKCKSAVPTRLGVVANCSGDPFKLASGKIPFVLKKGRSQLAEIKRICS